MSIHFKHILIYNLQNVDSRVVVYFSTETENNNDEKKYH